MKILLEKNPNNKTNITNLIKTSNLYHEYNFQENSYKDVVIDSNTINKIAFIKYKNDFFNINNWYIKKIIKLAEKLEVDDKFVDEFIDKTVVLDSDNYITNRPNEIDQGVINFLIDETGVIKLTGDMKRIKNNLQEVKRLFNLFKELKYCNTFSIKL